MPPHACYLVITNLSPTSLTAFRCQHPLLMAVSPHLAGDNTVMLKEPLRSPVSVLKNLKAGTSKIHRNSLLPLRTFKLCKKNKNKETQQGRNLNSETQCKSQIWWFSEWHWGFLWGRGRVVRDGFSCWPLCLTGFHLPHPAALLYSVLHLWKCLKVGKKLASENETAEWLNKHLRLIGSCNYTHSHACINDTHAHNSQFWSEAFPWKLSLVINSSHFIRNNRSTGY